MSVSGFSGEWGGMLAFFKAVQGVDYYEVEPQEVVPDFQAGINPDPNQVQVLNTFPIQTFSDGEVLQYTADVVAQLTDYGYAQVPLNFRIIGLAGTNTFSAYRWRVSACNAGGCSAPSNWALFFETLPWPW
jgi:hypothetical protein